MRTTNLTCNKDPYNDAMIVPYILPVSASKLTFKFKRINIIRSKFMKHLLYYT